MRRLLSIGRVSLLVSAVVAVVRLIAAPPLELLDLKVLDFRHTLRGPLPPPASVTIVGLDEPSLARVGRWPWPRARLAEMVERLSQAGAAAIVFDVMLEQSEQETNLDRLRAALAEHPEQSGASLLAAVEAGDDERLARAFAASGRAVLACFFEFSGSPSPGLAADVASLPPLVVRSIGGASVAAAHRLERATRAHVAIPVLAQAAAGSGHINFLPDADGIYRRLPAAIRAGDRLVPPLGVATLGRLLGGVSATATLAPDGVHGLRVGDRELPVDDDGQLWINYLGPPGTVPHVSAMGVLSGGLRPGSLAGRTAIVGFTAAGFDEVATPFAPVMPGVEVQATVLANLLDGTELRRPWWLVPAEALLILLLGSALGRLLGGLSTGGATLAAIALAVAYFWAAQRLFGDAHLAVGGFYPLAAMFLSTLGGVTFRSVVEEGEKRRVRAAFRHYVNPEVTDMLAAHPERLRLGGERREITVLFVDVRGFTGISESLPPEQLGELLNEYLGAMTQVVFRHRGLLDKYIGDAVMAFWGAPVPLADHARAACEAALDMVAALPPLHERWRARGLPALDIGVAIATGDAVVGNFGSADRFNYTAVGDTVNLAARIEPYNKEFGTRVLITEVTRAALGSDFVCREIERLRVRGRTQEVAVYEVLGRRGDDDGRLAARAAGFEAARASWNRGAVAEAIAALAALIATHPEDAALHALRTRCERSTR